MSQDQSDPPDRRRRAAKTTPLPRAMKGSVDEVRDAELGPVEEFTLSLPADQAHTPPGEETMSLLYEDFDEATPVSRAHDPVENTAVGRPVAGEGSPDETIGHALTRIDDDTSTGGEPLRRVVMPTDIAADEPRPPAPKVERRGSRPPARPQPSRPAPAPRRKASAPGSPLAVQMASASVRKPPAPSPAAPDPVDDDKTQARIVRPKRVPAAAPPSPPAASTSSAKPAAGRIERRATYHPAPKQVPDQAAETVRLREPKLEEPAPPAPDPGIASGKPKLARVEDLGGETEAHYNEPVLAWVASAIGMAFFASAMLFLGAIVAYLFSSAA